MSYLVTLSYKSLRTRRLCNNHSIIFKATIVHSFFTKHLLCWVHENAVQELYSVSIVKRRKQAYSWLMRHWYILLVQSMDFTKWWLPFSSCLQDAGINEAPRTFSQYVRPTVVAVRTQIFTSCLSLAFPYFVKWGHVLILLPLNFTLMPLGFYLHRSPTLPIAVMFRSISEDFFPLLLHLFPRSHKANLRWWLLL